MYLERVFGTSVRSEVDLEGGPSSEQTPRAQKGMIIPFKPLSLTFRNVNYYVDMPPVSAKHRSRGMVSFTGSSTASKVALLCSNDDQ